MVWVIDFEASGLDDDSYPIEVGLVGDNFEYQALIRPDSDWNFWDDFAAETHGISQPELLSNGLPCSKVSNDLNVFLGSSQVFCDSLPWDKFWLSRLYEGSGIQPSFNLIAAPYLEDEGGDRAHRALEDARRLYALLESMKM